MLRFSRLLEIIVVAGICASAGGVSVRAQPAEIEAAAACTLVAGPVRSVVRVIDGETVLLDDHQEVRLIGALAPRSPDLKPDAQAWAPEEAGIVALKELVLGKSVSLASARRAQDRYGRKLAHLFVERDGERVWVQGALLAGGHARAYGLPDSFACMPEMLAHERVARTSGVGLWGNAAYDVRPARAARELLRRRNAFEIVAGPVAKVAVTKTRTYLNFGPDWRTDFTAGIEAKVLRAHPEWAKTLAALEGRRVEVRGWIQYRNGPYIDIEDPSQITGADEALPGRTPPPQSAVTSSGRETLPQAGGLEGGKSVVEEEPRGEKKERPEPSATDALDL